MVASVGDPERRALRLVLFTLPSSLFPTLTEDAGEEESHARGQPVSSRSALRRAWDNLALRTFGYYAVLFALLAIARRTVPGFSRVLLLPGTMPLTGTSRSDFLSAGTAAPADPLSQMTSAATAMAVAALLSVPVAWLYIMTRRKKGFRQSVVHTLIVLPVVVSGVVVLVKSSLALAFALAGIVAAVRFRNTLEDSKDAVYIFLATAVGLAAGVDPPVALAISLIYNVVILSLWYTDFGRTSAVFEGNLAQQRLESARQFAGRESSFVTRLDDEILKSLSAEQLDLVAERAWKRRKQAAPELDADESESSFDVLLRVRTHSPVEARRVTESVLSDQLKKWRLSGVATEGDVQVVEYAVRLRKSVTPNTLRDALEQAQSPHIIGVELH